MTFYIVVFSYFPHMVLGVLHKYTNLQIYPSEFLKIIFILCNVQVLRGSVTIQKIVTTCPSHQLSLLARPLRPTDMLFTLQPSGHLTCIKGKAMNE
jgi:hypothetical protein